jgi:hypothetical protein
MTFLKELQTCLSVRVAFLKHKYDTGMLSSTLVDGVSGSTRRCNYSGRWQVKG